MSNFQRTRSKVWWDSEDDYPSYRTPKTYVNSCEQNNDNKLRSFEEKSSNLYQYQKQNEEHCDNINEQETHNQNTDSITNRQGLDKNLIIEDQNPDENHNSTNYLKKVDNIDQVDNSSNFGNQILQKYLGVGIEDVTKEEPSSSHTNSPRPSLRILRPTSPASHRSQDSGFSDSDCSPSQVPRVSKTEIKREGNWQEVIESLKISKSSDAIYSHDMEKAVSPQPAPRKTFTPDLQKIRSTPLKNFLETHQSDEKYEPKSTRESTDVRRRPKLLSVQSCPDGRPNSVHRLIYKFDHGVSPLPGYKPHGIGGSCPTKSIVTVGENNKTDCKTTIKINPPSPPEVFRDTPKVLSRKLEYVDYSQMSYSPIKSPTYKECHTADQSIISISPVMHGEIEPLPNFPNSPLNSKIPCDDENVLNESKISSKKRIDTFNQGAIDDTYFYKKRKAVMNKSLPNPGTKNKDKYKVNLTMPPINLATEENAIAHSDSNHVTNVSVNSYNSIDDYDILYQGIKEPNNNVQSPDKINQVELKSSFSTPAGIKRCYNNETYELELPSAPKPYAGKLQVTKIGLTSVPSRGSDIMITDAYLGLNPNYTSTPKWYKPSDIKPVTPVSHREINVHRRVNLLADFNASPEDSDKEDKLDIKIVDDKVQMKSKRTNCENDNQEIEDRSKSKEEAGITREPCSKGIFEEPKLENEAVPNKNIFENKHPEKICKKESKNIFEKMFGKKNKSVAHVKKLSTPELKENNDIKMPQSIKKKPECVKSWLQELRGHCESEAMTALQNKAIRGNINVKTNIKFDKGVESVVQNVNAVRRIAVHAAGVLDELETAQRSICQNKLEISGPLVQSAVGGVASFAKSYEITPSSRLLIELCDATKVRGKLMDSETLTRIAAGVRTHVEELCFRYLELLTDVLEEPPSSKCLSAALTGLNALCSAYGGAIGYSALKAGLIRALLIVCVNSHTYTLRQNPENTPEPISAPSSSLGKALRVLATLCQTEQSIRQFCQAGGISVILDILEDKRCAEPERREAAAVLTQITGPWVTRDSELPTKDTNGQKWNWRQELNKHKSQLVRALTDLLSETKCCQTLLLCAAALANTSLPRMTLSNETVNVTESLAWCEAATELLKAVKRRGPGCSVFLQEQTSSLLCNLSAIQDCRRRLCPWSKNPTISVEPLMALYSFLNICKRYLAPEESSFRRGVTRASERMDISPSLLQDQTRSSTKSERLPRNTLSPEASIRITAAEKASAERMLISTTLCLTRFCRDHEISRSCSKLGAHGYLIMAEELLRRHQEKTKDVLGVCEEAVKIMTRFNNKDSSLVTTNESYV